MKIAQFQPFCPQTLKRPNPPADPTPQPPENQVTLGDRIKGAAGGALQGVGWGIPTGFVRGTMIALPATAIVAMATNSPDAAMATLLGVMGTAIPLGVLGCSLTFGLQGWQEGKNPDTTIYRDKDVTYYD